MSSNYNVSQGLLQQIIIYFLINILIYFFLTLALTLRIQQAIFAALLCIYLWEERLLSGLI